MGRNTTRTSSRMHVRKPKQRGIGHVNTKSKETSTPRVRMRKRTRGLTHTKPKRRDISTTPNDKNECCNCARKCRSVARPSELQQCTCTHIIARAACTHARKTVDG
eukprot:scaffold271931_cov19-Tisochrysis_lutea.AAC.1